MENDCKMVKAMTRYQKAVSDHMATAPQELRDYVCGRLKESIYWEKGTCPINFCGFNWEHSKEAVPFWNSVKLKGWKEAMDTKFWKSRRKINLTFDWRSDSRALVNNNDLRQQLADVRLQLANVQKKCNDLEARLRSIQNLSDI
jgi:hypothetical protein